MAERKQRADRNRPAAWETLSTTEEADCRIFSVVRKQCRHPVRRREADFYVLKSSDWVNAIAVTSDGRLVMVEQYRFGSDTFSLEITGGVMDLGEDPIEAAERELSEETGYVGRRSRLLGSVRPNPAIQSNWCHIVLIEEAEHLVDTDWDENEELVLHLPTIEEAYGMAYSGEITHALTLNALLLYQPVRQANLPSI